jgi:hypothetical protein
MSNTRKALTVDKLEDITLGAFSNLRPSETLDHLIRYLSTWNGSECVILFFSITGTQTRLVVVIIASYSWYVSPSELRNLPQRCSTEWFAKKKKLIQYGAKVLVPILQAKARLQHRAGLRDDPTSSFAPKLAKLASIISDARTLWGIWGTCFVLPPS